MRQGAKRLSQLPDPVLDQMIQRLENAFHPERIFLVSNSDYDLLVVVEPSSLPRYRRNQLAFQTLQGLPASKDVIVKKQDVPCPLPATVSREGRLVPARR